MDTRRREVKNLNFQPKRTTEELALVLTDITQALRLLAPEANEARKTIEQHTPSIADLARELAEKTRKLEEETKADAKDAEATEDPETKRADIQELQDKQEVDAGAFRPNERTPTRCQHPRCSLRRGPGTCTGR